jgi:hypothetical protein
MLSSQVFARFGRLFVCLLACLLVLLRLLLCVFLRSLLNIIVSSFRCQLIWLSHARARVKLKELYIVWISRLRARLNRGVARSGEPVDFTGLYMQVSFTNLSKEWRELWFSSRMWGEFRHLSCTIAYALGARLGGFLSDTRSLCKFEVPVYRVRELAFWRRLGDFSESFKLM